MVENFLQNTMNEKVTNDMLHLIWDNHLENIANLFKTLYDDHSLVDVTLSCRDGDIKAHKLVLSACSPYFQRIFNDNPHPHPVVILRGVRHCEMIRIVEFMYKGIIDVPAPLFVNLMHIANDLEIKAFERFSNGNDGDTDNITTHSNSLTVETVKVPQNSTAKKTNENGAANNPQVGRDTRYHGRKRVAVDYSDEEDPNERKLDRKNNSFKIVTEKTADERNNTTTEKNVAVIKSKKRNDVDNHQTNLPENPENANAEEEVDGTTISDSYTCSTCSSSFKSKDDLIEHFKYHNQNTEKSENTLKFKICTSYKKPLHRRKSIHMFYCDLCGKDFSKLSKLKNHVRTTHELQPSNLLPLPKSNTHNSAEADINIHLKKEKHDSCNKYEAAFLHELQLQQVNEKRGRGRPRKYPVPPLLLPKRARGRPKGSKNNCNESGGLQYSEMTFVDGNYDVTNLPYGDFSYLTMPEKISTVETPKENGVQKVQKKAALIKVERAPPQISELSIVATNTPVITSVGNVATTQNKEVVNTYASKDPISEFPIIIEPYIEITADDTEFIDPSNNSRLLNPFYADPSLQAIGQIGECTVISLTQQTA